MTDYSSLEQDLGYTFVDKKLLETAFTHTTYVFETGRGHWESNQRLEFIGDAVLDVVVGQMIYELKPQADEGYLSHIGAFTGHVWPGDDHHSVFILVKDGIIRHKTVLGNC